MLAGKVEGHVGSMNGVANLLVSAYTRGSLAVMGSKYFMLKRNELKKDATATSRCRKSQHFEKKQERLFRARAENINHILIKFKHHKKSVLRKDGDIIILCEIYGRQRKIIFSEADYNERKLIEHLRWSIADHLKGLSEHREFKDNPREEKPTNNFFVSPPPYVFEVRKNRTPQTESSNPFGHGVF